MSTTTKFVLYEIEGNIGCGKSTLLREVAAAKLPDVVVLMEPVDEWARVLTAYYRDRASMAMELQASIVLSKLAQLAKVLASDAGRVVIIMERSIRSGYLFVKQLVDEGILAPEKLTTALQWLHYCDDIFPVNNASRQTLYLRTSPETCLQRVTQRARTGEEPISQELINDLHRLHDEAHAKGRNNIILDGERSVQELLEEILTCVTGA